MAKGWRPERGPVSGKNEPGLYLVFGGKVKDPRGQEFMAPDLLDIRGIFATYDEAFAAWRGASQAAVDDAYMKYLIVRLQ